MKTHNSHYVQEFRNSAASMGNTVILQDLAAGKAEAKVNTFHIPRPKWWYTSMQYNKKITEKCYAKASQTGCRLRINNL